MDLLFNEIFEIPNVSSPIMIDLLCNGDPYIVYLVCYATKGKLVAPLSLKCLSCMLREEIPVVGLFPIVESHDEKESSRPLPLM